MITIVDYGVGNPDAIVNMLDFIGFDALITDDPLVIRNASHLVLPGVGAFDAAMEGLLSSKLVPPLEDAVFDRKVPLLGVCLGMQLLGRRSEEGVLDGLGWIAANTIKMRPDPAARLRVPFMGWADIHPISAPSLGFTSRTATSCAVKIGLISLLHMSLMKLWFVRYSTITFMAFNFIQRKAIGLE